jgi:Protein of unknown function (DUF1573)
MKVKTVQKLLLGLAVLLWGAQANAQDWAEKMFEKTSHDFGVVARGADARYRLKLTNKYKEPVHIASVTTTCGCTAAKPSKDMLASLETAYVEITMNTVKFTHEKTSSVTVVIDQPLYAEVRIPIKAWIRTDVVLTPGGAGFGSVTKGADQERKIAVAYAGRSDWKIKEVISKNPNLTAKFVETRRDGGNVNYDLIISLKGSTPLGEIRDQLTLVTDETPNPYIPLLVEGRVENEYSITPELVSFGNLNPGEKRTVNIVVKGKKPFSIEKIESEKSSGTFEVRLPKDSRPVHVVPLTVIAPSDPGTLAEEFTVTIAGLAEPVTFKAYGKIGSTTGTAATGKPGDAATANKNAP